MSKKINNTPRRLLTASMSLALLISLSSCSGATNTTGNLLADDTYASAGGYKVTYGDLWNELQWSANSVLNDKITNVILNEKINIIDEIIKSEDLKALSDKIDKEKLGIKVEEDLTNLKNDYKERLADYVLQDIYDQTFNKDGYWDAINEMKEKAKRVSIEKYVDGLYLSYHKYFRADRETSVNDLLNVTEDNIDALVDLANEFKDIYYPLLAKELLAFDNLDEQIKKALEEDDDEDDDKVGYFTHSQYKTMFENNYSNKYDLDVLMIRFTSEKEFEDTLRAFGIKIHNKQYYFIEDTKNGMDESVTYEEYIKRYDDIKDYENTNGVQVISEEAILEIYIQLYNYIYSGLGDNLKKPLTGQFAVDYSQKQLNDLRGITDDILELYGKNTKKLYENNIKNLKDAAATTYKSEELNDISSTYKDYLYETLRSPILNNEATKADLNKKPYSTSTQSANSGYYIAYRYGDHLTDLSAEAQEYENYFKDSDLTSYEVYEDLANNEAEDYLFENKNLKSEIEAMLKKDQLTETLINTALDEEKKDVKIKIYNEALEISYKKDHPDYSKTLKGADKNLLAAITYNGETTNLTITDAFDVLEKKSGANTAIDLISDQIIKDQKEFEENKKDKKTISYYEEYLDTLLVNFANGGLAQQGYDASIGKYDFLMLYFHTADVNQIVEDYFVVQHTANQLLTDYSSTSLAEFFQEYTTSSYESYFSLNGSRLVVYMDADDDNEADDVARWANEIVTFEGNPVKRSEVARSLIFKMYNKISASTIAHKDKMTALVDEFNNTSRAKFEINPIAPENEWSEYRHLGFKVKIEEFTTTNTDVEIDKNLKNRLYDYATKPEYEFFKDGQAPTAYIEKLNPEDIKDDNKIVQTEDGFNLILVTTGQAKPSAKWTTEQNKDGLMDNTIIKYNDKYVEIGNIENEDDKLSLEQIRLFLLDNAVNGSSTLSPSTLSQALTTFLQPVLQRYSSAETQRIILLTFIKEKANPTAANIYDAVSFDKKLDYNGEGKYIDNMIQISHSIVDNYVEVYKEDYPQANVFDGWWDNLLEKVPTFFNKGGQQ